MYSFAINQTNSVINYVQIKYDNYTLLFAVNFEGTGKAFRIERR